PLSSRTSFFKHPAPPALYTLSLHDALPISKSRSLSSSIGWPSGKPNSARQRSTRSASSRGRPWTRDEYTLSTATPIATASPCRRSEEHTSELQSRGHLVCRLLLEKKK